MGSMQVEHLLMKRFSNQNVIGMMMKSDSVDVGKIQGMK